VRIRQDDERVSLFSLGPCNFVSEVLDRDAGGIDRILDRARVGLGPDRLILSSQRERWHRDQAHEH
jgi:hypothetical protein